MSESKFDRIVAFGGIELPQLSANVARVWSKLLMLTNAGMFSILCDRWLWEASQD
jgi:hypothetical protein